MPLLQVQHLQKKFATQHAVNNISFSIEAGTIFGLLGPNGAGKTTLLRMLTGITYPDSGSITLLGKAFVPDVDNVHIGYMPEERGLYKKMKIGEQAIYLARLKGLSNTDANTKVKMWFDKLDMQSWWNKKVEDLSKGMQQKLQFVVTVLHEPKLIILDEPFSGLDPVNANLIKQEIYQLAQAGHTIIFSTHRMEQVEEICTQIILVNKGEKILDSTVTEAKNTFKQNLYNLSLQANSTLPLGSTYTITKQQHNVATIQLLSGVSTNQALSEIIQSNTAINGFTEVLPSINDVFINLVSKTPSARQFDVVV